VNAVQNGGQIARELIDSRSTRGAQLARQLRFGDAVADAIAALGEHWDGSGAPEGMSGEEIPLHARIARLAQRIDVFHASAGAQATREAVARASGRQLDPRLCELFDALSRDPAFWTGLAAEDLPLRVVEMEPARRLEPVDDDHLDDIAQAFGEVVDAKSPFTAGHSARVAQLADRICRELGLDAGQRRWLRRGALLHDLGKLGVSNTILDKPGKLDPWEWAEMQRHATHTERILEGVGSFGTLARVAGAHHEKLDGGGYPRGLDARHIRLETRIITTADVFDALTTERPHRAAMPAREALAVMQEGVGSTTDADCLAALRRALDGFGGA
jgi:putative nucleotidyltransferase with HDIG domain